MATDAILLLLAAILFVAALSCVAAVFVMLNKTRRRGQEYELLTRIGQAMNSRLHRDDILNSVHHGLGHLFDTSNFFVAFEDGGSLRYDLEVHAGVVMPRRSRPLMPSLTEHILRNGSPMLVEEDIEQVRQKLGLISSNKPARSFCGVPLKIKGVTKGVMAAVSYDREHAYSKRDLEIMRIAAGYLSVALENAELFEQEHRRAKYLDFLNNVSRAAIASKTPEQMLQQVVGHVHMSFGFAHTTVSLLDYATKELEVKAEAGEDEFRAGLGKRTPLDGDVLDSMARATSLTTGTNAPSEPVDTALWHPITYGETLLGILKVEPGPRREFSTDEVLILGTLADLLAAALNNLMNYRRMEYESITDSLTNLKTRRYFLESITVEFKRASRSGRPFSLVMIDLDKFKHVNDDRGHLEGDLVLARVGRILEQKIRQSNVVARYGGDEFIVLMPETNIDQAQILAERLRMWIATDSMLGERGISGSFGISSFPLHGSSIEEIMRNADEAMYRSKSQGGNRVSQATPHKDLEEIRDLRQLVSEYLDPFMHPGDTTEPNGQPHNPDDLPRELKLALRQVSDRLSMGERRRGLMESIRLVSVALEGTEDHASGHGEYVAGHCEAVARELRLSPEELTDLRYAALVHDVGKLVVPRSVLNKAGALNEAEYALVRKHAQAGAEIISAIPNSERMQSFVRGHHERYDGKGYPLGLKGEQIPLGARIVAIAEAYAWLTSNHSYSAAKSFDAAIALIEAGRGSKFDPLLVDLFVKQIRGEQRMLMKA